MLQDTDRALDALHRLKLGDLAFDVCWHAYRQAATLRTAILRNHYLTESSRAAAMKWPESWRLDAAAHTILSELHRNYDATKAMTAYLDIVTYRSVSWFHLVSILWTEIV